MKKLSSLVLASCCLVMAGVGIAATTQDGQCSAAKQACSEQIVLTVDAKADDCCPGTSCTTITKVNTEKAGSCCPSAKTETVAFAAVSDEKASQCCPAARQAKLVSLTEAATKNVCSTSATKALFAAVEDLGKNCNAACETSATKAIERFVTVMADHNIQVTFAAISATPAQAVQVSKVTATDCASACTGAAQAVQVAAKSDDCAAACTGAAQAVQVAAKSDDCAAACTGAAQAVQVAAKSDDCAAACTGAAQAVQVAAKSDDCAAACGAAQVVQVAAKADCCPFGKAADEYVAAITAAQKSAGKEGCAPKLAVQALLMTIAHKQWYTGENPEAVFAAMFKPQVTTTASLGAMSEAPACAAACSAKKAECSATCSDKKE